MLSRTPGVGVAVAALAMATACAQERQREIIFKEDFADAALPGWPGAWPATAKCSRTEGPGGIPALTMGARETVQASRSMSLPADRLAGKAVLLEVWRKAENVKTGARHYYNAKFMQTRARELEAGLKEPKGSALNDRVYEIGNESYGPDPTGSCSADEYARAFPAHVKAMKARGPSIKIAMNGGHPDWNDTILRLAGRHADAF